MKLRHATEALARKTSRRGFFGRGAELAFGMLAGAAAGTALRSNAGAGVGTVCAFPYGAPCPCDGCQSSGVCAKPCVVLTAWYVNGCWVEEDATTCCDCDCPDVSANNGWCGCGSDYHNNPANCPN
jgi:hypothetical protein